MPKVRSSSFIGPDSAWFVTLDGDLLRTENRGETWNRTTGGAVRRFKEVSFVDPLLGWAINDQGEFWNSDDGGLHWHLIAKLIDGERVDGFSFVDQLHGWAIEPFSVWRSNDGGLSWQRQLPLSNPDHITESIHHFFLINAQIAWLTGERGAVYQTSDGGKSWRAQRPIGRDSDAGAIFFIDERTGWLCSNPRASIYRTDDGGATWHKQELPSQSLWIYSIHFLNKNQGWAVGSDRESEESTAKKIWGVVLRTIDGGRTWQLIQHAAKESFYDRVYFADAQNGWLIGPDNVDRTNDGGAAWSLVLRLSTR